jgi:hypothetical protein
MSIGSKFKAQEPLVASPGVSNAEVRGKTESLGARFRLAVTDWGSGVHIMELLEKATAAWVMRTGNGNG